VVDDSMLIRHTVCRYLEDRGLGVESATDGLEALEMLKSIRPDIIVTDIQMPKLDGHRLIEVLKSNPETSRIPIVVLAGSSSSMANTAGTLADYVILKTIDIEGQLQQVLKTAFPNITFSE